MGKVMKVQSGASRALTAEELAWMRDWRGLDFLSLEIHAELEHQVRVCMNGDENAIVVGEGGLGKSRSVQVICDKLEGEEVELSIRTDGAHQPRRILRYDASRAQGTKTALLDLWARAIEGVPSAGMQRRSSPHLIIQEIVQTLEMRNVALIVVDEAQMIAPDNLDLLRQVPDAAKARAYHLSLVLIGSPALRAALVATKHLGQRFSAELNFQPLTNAQWTQHASGFHPHLREMKSALPSTEWQALMGEIWRATSGKFRRIEKVMINANTLALSWKRPVDPEILRFALDKLAGET
jgi:type II secretory pathway predicted ATPase ExeA